MQPRQSGAGTNRGRNRRMRLTKHHRSFVCFSSRTITPGPRADRPPCSPSPMPFQHRRNLPDHSPVTYAIPAFSELTQACPELALILETAFKLRHGYRPDGYCLTYTWPAMRQQIVELVSAARRLGNPVLSHPGALASALDVILEKLPPCAPGCGCRKKPAGWRKEIYG
jgi:hypothetical protein